ncbi:unnamed protein product [Leptosia nina]|uniref:Uncharacterized protein n=1 Tax=Leptosia nina TaxID=320188 RepID=A0AAV1JWE8_9NEOP
MKRDNGGLFYTTVGGITSFSQLRGLCQLYFFALLKTYSCIVFTLPNVGLAKTSVKITFRVAKKRNKDDRKRMSSKKLSGNDSYLCRYPTNESLSFIIERVRGATSVIVARHTLSGMNARSRTLQPNKVPAPNKGSRRQSSADTHKTAIPLPCDAVRRRSAERKINE